MKIGFLPLYVKLYDDVVPGVRPRMNAFYETVAQEFEKRGMEVVRSPFCRLKDEFKAAVQSFEAEGAEAIVTLHIAYSPSLESIEALSDTQLPIVVLDTTETLEFDNLQSGDEVMHNHGIHGVMDMCSMLTQRGVDYAIAAGHWKESNVIDRVCGLARAAAAAKALKKAKVALVGGNFAGMGDFRVSYGELASKFGIDVLQPGVKELKPYFDGLTAEEIAAEKAENAARFDFHDNIVEAEYDFSVRSCLAMRKYVQDQKLTGFTVNFMGVGADSTGFNSMPFVEACKAMERGIGYAGEGDVMTAAFVGALLNAYKETTFVEIFCPDWKNDIIFLSHMGEMNYRIADTKPLLSRLGTKYGTGDEYPYAAYARMKGGKGVYLNVSRSAEDYRLFIAEAEMLSYESDNFPTSMRGWMKPDGYTVSEFLEEHSRWGATHHSIFVYGATAEEMEYFGKLLGMETVTM